MSYSYSSLTIVGNLGADPELKHLSDGTAVCNFRVAVNEKVGKGDQATKVTTWFKVTAWNQLAELCAQYLTVGRSVLVVGKIGGSAYTDKNGHAAFSLELRARDVVFLDKKTEEEPAGQIEF